MSASSHSAASPITTAITVNDSPDGTRTIALPTKLDFATVPHLWDDLLRHSTAASRAVVLDASDVNTLDAAGLALIVRARSMATNEFKITNLSPNLQRVLDLYTGNDFSTIAEREKTTFIVDFGNAAIAVGKAIRDQVVFIGSVLLLLPKVIRSPRLIRLSDTLTTIEKAGIRALPVASLVGFLVGFILGFQGAIPLKMFGAEIFIPSLVSLVILRELGPLMAALILAGRSSSAFAAEIGTMKVNEEVNALTTFGLDPTRFLVLPRLIAGFIVAPILTVFSNIAGVMGGFVVFTSMGFPPVMFINQLQQNLSASDVYSGMIKTFVFGVLVAGVGCLRGLQTKSGPTAVGDSTTSAVVSAIVLVVIADGIFAVIFYSLGI